MASEERGERVGSGAEARRSPAAAAPGSLPGLAADGAQLLEGEVIGRCRVPISGAPGGAAVGACELRLVQLDDPRDLGALVLSAADDQERGAILAIVGLALLDQRSRTILVDLFAAAVREGEETVRELLAGAAAEARPGG